MARLGGAEFVILIEDVKDKKYLSALAERVQKTPYTTRNTMAHNKEYPINLFDYFEAGA
jgi:GGDEF domain-containing protein